jgi:hypothetical protein
MISRWRSDRRPIQVVGGELDGGPQPGRHGHRRADQRRRHHHDGGRGTEKKADEQEYPPPRPGLGGGVQALIAHL